MIDVLYLQLYMKIVKLNAIDSTNAYLRDLSKKKVLENWTVVTAQHQLKGKGQQENLWLSEKGKNLTFSVLIKPNALAITDQFYLNFSISLAIYHVLKFYIPDKLTVKWPNDILSANHKICGILIDSSVKNAIVHTAIVGIGLNVNQVNFGTDLQQATSLKKILAKDIDLDELLKKIILEIQYQTLLIEQKNFMEIKKRYEAILYKKDKPAMFEDLKQRTFVGKIKGVNESGKLLIELEDEQIKAYNLKQIKFKRPSGLI